MPGPHERLILWRLAEATRDPVSFTNAFQAIQQTLQYSNVAPEPNASPWGQASPSSGSSFADTAIAFGLGVLFGSLFVPGKKPNSPRKKAKRTKKGTKKRSTARGGKI